eukprot:7354052-Prymnesium_polylepis.1
MALLRFHISAGPVSGCLSTSYRRFLRRAAHRGVGICVVRRPAAMQAARGSRRTARDSPPLLTPHSADRVPRCTGSAAASRLRSAPVWSWRDRRRHDLRARTANSGTAAAAKSRGWSRPGSQRRGGLSRPADSSAKEPWRSSSVDTSRPSHTA